MLTNEVEIVTPLTSDEIKDGIAHTIAVAVRQRLDKSCRLYGKSYPKFRALISVKIELDNFGLTTEDNHTVEIDEEGEQILQPELKPSFTDPQIEEIDVEIPETPPNQFRRDTEQPIPTAVPQPTRAEEKPSVFQAKRGRPKGSVNRG